MGDRPAVKLGGLPEMLARLQDDVPAAMRDRAQWLLWKFKPNGEGKKPRKMPHYISGALRQGQQGSDADRAALCGFDAALAQLATGRYEGLGFAFLPGDGLIGIDIDGAIDTETGEVSERCAAIIAACASYTELSPSGTGVHIIVEGETHTFKDNSIGLEVFCGSQFFTVSGRRWAGTPDQVVAIEPATLRRLQATVAEARQTAAGKTVDLVKPAAVAPVSKADDFARVNAAGMALLDLWVPSLFPTATKSGAGGAWRVTSKALGRTLEEDLSLHFSGIKDFGTEQGLSPIDVVMTFGGKSAGDALRWLASAIGMAVEPPRSPRANPQVVALRPAVVGDSSPPPSAADENPPSPARGEGRARNRQASRKTLDLVDVLSARFALVYATSTAWDRREELLIKIPDMRLAFGKEAVSTWLARPSRSMIRPTDLVFEPGDQVVPPQINMFSGLELEPTPCTAAEVKPMLDLLRHLCGESADTADGVDEVMHWVLRWQALPLQQLGAKMQTACVFHGAQGTGKNLYWDVWRDLFGDYGITVGQTELEDKFNGWISRKLAIIGDEVVSRQEMYHNKNRLKLVVTQESKFPIRGMQMETRWESNHANVVFLSNESQPLALEERDRRFMVIYTPLEADSAIYEAVRDFKASGGAAKWLYYLMTYGLGDFTAHTKPLMTRAKEDLIESGWRPSQRFAHEWLSGLLDLPVRVCSAEQLYRAFGRWVSLNGERFPPSQSAFTNEVKRWVSERVQRDSAGQREEPKLSYKVINLMQAATAARKSVRCWLPKDSMPPAGVKECDWATDSVRGFEQAISNFCRRAGDDQGDGA